MLPPDQLDELLTNSDASTSINQDTARYLQHIESQLYADIQMRKRFDFGLLFLACQVGSASLSWLLFNLQVTLIIIQVASFTLAMMPGLVDLSESFSFELSSERWELKHVRPMQTLTKLSIGVAVGWTSTKRISEEIYNTHQAIKSTYTEIKTAEGLSGFQLPSMSLVLAAVLLLFSLLAVLNMNQKNVDV
ncbi:MAG: hypothetical protein KME59_20520 [Trichormus sp. ATA11-4-KO1]|jgi:hypothetical protein|nr:hypothetical protein [Trichormus sp. ATA11-4-KO1]